MLCPFAFLHTDRNTRKIDRKTSGEHYLKQERGILNVKRVFIPSKRSFRWSILQLHFWSVGRRSGVCFATYNFTYLWNVLHPHILWFKLKYHSLKHPRVSSPLITFPSNLEDDYYESHRDKAHYSDGGHNYVSINTHVHLCLYNRLFETELPADIPRDLALMIAQSCHKQVIGSPVRMILKQQMARPQDAIFMINGNQEVSEDVNGLKAKGYTEGYIRYT